MAKASIYCIVNNINDKHDRKELKRELDNIPGFMSVSINDSEDKIAVDIDTSGVEKSQIITKIEKLGYEIIDSKPENHVM